MGQDTSLDVLCVSVALRRALDPTLLSRRYGTAPLLVAVAMLTAAARFLTYLGGATAAAETLRCTAGRVERGEFPEPTHPAGTA